jgi:hypothetical protein
MKMTRLMVFVLALVTPLVITQGVATASPLTYDFSGTFDMGPLSGTSFTGTFTYGAPTSRRTSLSPSACSTATTPAR